MKTGIFGGTFDPVHNQHVKMAETALRELGLDRLLIMPAGSPPHKDEGVTEARHRLAMTQLAFSKLPRIEIREDEINSAQPSYTYLTLERLRALYPDDQLVLLIGGDSMRDIFRWKHPERIAAAAELAVFERKGWLSSRSAAAAFRKKLGGRTVYLKESGEHVSSTEVKILTEFALPIEGIVPKAVADYIARIKLYASMREFVGELQRYLPERRYRHTAYVAVEAVSLAKQTGVDPEKAFLAAALHDVAKKLSVEQLKELGYLPDPEIPEPVVHAFAGAYMAEHIFGVEDPDVINAIRYHTTGRPAMSKLEKVIYVADCIEKTRDYEGVGSFRRAVYRDFESGFLCCMKGTIELLDRSAGRQRVSKLTREAYEYYTARGKGEPLPGLKSDSAEGRPSRSRRGQKNKKPPKSGRNKR